MLDIIIKNGFIADGTGAPGFTGDVGVKDGKIVYVGKACKESAAEVIDASGLTVSPGFIDTHTHSDERIFTGSDSYSHLEQGVTTQIPGQCGSSPTPYTKGSMDYLKQRGSAEDFARWEAEAETPQSFMMAAEKASMGTNTAFFIGHGAIRERVMGFSDARPTPAQMDQMKAYIREAMEAGYLGYSSGLVYAPSVYGDTKELTELACVMAPYGGIYASHIRGEGNNVLASVREALEIGRGANVTCWISHLKVSGKRNEGNSAQLLSEIDSAVAAGQDVYCDQYPYNAGSAPLISQIPPRFLVGGHAQFLERIKDKAFRREILAAIYDETDIFESSVYSAGFEGCLVVEAEKTPENVNLTLAQIALRDGCDPIDAYCELLINNDGVGQGIYFSQNASDVLRVMGHERVFCGSDWSDYPDSRVDPATIGNGHPRGTGTMVRRLELVRDFRLRSLEESVHNLTLAPATALGLDAQGCLKEGYDANISVFDYDNLHAPADYIHPYKPNLGIECVIVNGKVAVRGGRATGVRAGKLIKRSSTLRHGIGSRR